jgi:hypothetical protein
MWRAHKASGRPWPILSEDEVLDYLILEAVAVKASKEDAEAVKQTEVERWKRDTSQLEAFR